MSQKSSVSSNPSNVPWLLTPNSGRRVAVGSMVGLIARRALSAASGHSGARRIPAIVAVLIGVAVPVARRTAGRGHVVARLFHRAEAGAIALASSPYSGGQMEMTVAAEMRAESVARRTLWLERLARELEVMQ